MLELPDQTVLDVFGRQTQLVQPANDHLEEEIAHIVAGAASEEADSDEAREEYAGRDRRAGLGEVEDDENATGG